MTATRLTALAAGLAMAGLATAAHAGSDLEKALEAGAERLTSDQIAERFIGNTAVFVADKTGDRYLVFYGENNELAGGKAGGDTSHVGFQAVSDRDQMCLGWQGRDLPRLRCLDVVLIDGVVHKFKADGSLSGRIVEFAEGNTT